MDNTNPLAKAFPVSVPACSKRTFCIAGILTTVYGIEELYSSNDDVAFIWLLHPRTLRQQVMELLAHSTIDHWNDHLSKSADQTQRPGLIAVTFDQRNHGSREVLPLANEDWRNGNETHAQDMFSIYSS